MGLLDMVEKHIIKEGVIGKVTMAYGDNNTGKTEQFSRHPKSLFLVFEQSAVNSLGVANVVDCSTFAKYQKFSKDLFIAKQKNQLIKSNIKKFTKKVNEAKSKLENNEDKTQTKSLENRVKELEKLLSKQEEKLEKDEFKLFTDLYDKLIFDSLTSFSMLAKRFVMDRNDAIVLNDGKWGALFKELENEFFAPYHNILSLGMTIFITAHRKAVRVGGTNDNPIYQYYPYGEKSVVKAIIDSCDIVMYLRKEYDDDGLEIDSSAHFRMTTEFFARCKWNTMVDYIHPYTMENLNEAINNAIAGVATESGVTPLTRKQTEEIVNETIIDNTEELKDKLQLLAEIFYIGEGDGDFELEEESEIFYLFNEAMVEILHGKKISHCNYKQKSHLESLYERVLPIAINYGLIGGESNLEEELLKRQKEATEE